MKQSSTTKSTYNNRLDSTRGTLILLKFNRKKSIVVYRRLSDCPPHNSAVSLGQNKKNMKILILTLSTLLMSCFHTSDSDTDNSCVNNEFEFSGCWVTQECKQADDGPGNLLERWHKSQYNFKANRLIEISAFEYNDSSCSGNAASLPIVGESPDIEYEVVGEITIEEGVPAIQLNITTFADNQEIKIGGGLVVTDTNELCSSKSFYFGPSGIRIGEGGIAKETELYENCLVRR